MKVHAAKEYDDTPRESRQQWTSLDEGKGEMKKTASASSAWSPSPCSRDKEGVINRDLVLHTRFDPLEGVC
jgi:hypothetical protein